MNSKALWAAVVVIVVIVAAAAVYVYGMNGSDSDSDDPGTTVSGDGLRTELAPGDTVVYNVAERDGDEELNEQLVFEVMFVTDDYSVFLMTWIDDDGSNSDFFVGDLEGILWLAVDEGDLTERVGTRTVETALGGIECEVWEIDWYSYYDDMVCQAWIGADGVVYGIYIEDGDYTSEMVLYDTTLLGEASAIGTAGDYSTDQTIEAGDVFQYIIVDELDVIDEIDYIEYGFMAVSIEVESIDGDTVDVHIETDSLQTSEDGVIESSGGSYGVFMEMDELQGYIYGYVTSNGYPEVGTDRVITYLGEIEAILCQDTVDGTEHTEWVDEDGNLFRGHTVVYENGEVVSETTLYVINSTFVRT